MRVTKIKRRSVRKTRIRSLDPKSRKLLKENANKKFNTQIRNKTNKFNNKILNNNYIVNNPTNLLKKKNTSNSQLNNNTDKNFSTKLTSEDVITQDQAKFRYESEKLLKLSKEMYEEKRRLEQEEGYKNEGYTGRAHGKIDWAEQVARKTPEWKDRFDPTVSDLQLKDTHQNAEENYLDMWGIKIKKFDHDKEFTWTKVSLEDSLISKPPKITFKPDDFREQPDLLMVNKELLEDAQDVKENMIEHLPEDMEQIGNWQNQHNPDEYNALSEFDTVDGLQIETPNDQLLMQRQKYGEKEDIKSIFRMLVPLMQDIKKRLTWGAILQEVSEIKQQKIEDLKSADVFDNLTELNRHLYLKFFSEATDLLFEKEIDKYIQFKHENIINSEKFDKKEAEEEIDQTRDSVKDRIVGDLRNTMEKLIDDRDKERVKKKIRKKKNFKKQFSSRRKEFKMRNGDDHMYTTNKHELQMSTSHGMPGFIRNHYEMMDKVDMSMIGVEPYYWDMHIATQHWTEIFGQVDGDDTEEGMDWYPNGSPWCISEGEKTRLKEITVYLTQHTTWRITREFANVMRSKIEPLKLNTRFRVNATQLLEDYYNTFYYTHKGSYKEIENQMERKGVSVVQQKNHYQEQQMEFNLKDRKHKENFFLRYQHFVKDLDKVNEGDDYKESLIKFYQLRKAETMELLQEKFLDLSGLLVETVIEKTTNKESEYIQRCYGKEFSTLFGANFDKGLSLDNIDATLENVLQMQNKKDMTREELLQLTDVIRQLRAMKSFMLYGAVNSLTRRLLHSIPKLQWIRKWTGMWNHNKERWRIQWKEEFHMLLAEKRKKIWEDKYNEPYPFYYYLFPDSMLADSGNKIRMKLSYHHVFPNDYLIEGAARRKNGVRMVTHIKYCQNILTPDQYKLFQEILGHHLKPDGTIVMSSRTLRSQDGNFVRVFKCLDNSLKEAVRIDELLKHDFMVYRELELSRGKIQRWQKKTVRKEQEKETKDFYMQKALHYYKNQERENLKGRVLPSDDKVDQQYQDFFVKNNEVGELDWKLDDDELELLAKEKRLEEKRLSTREQFDKEMEERNAKLKAMEEELVAEKAKFDAEVEKTRLKEQGLLQEEAEEAKEEAAEQEYEYEYEYETVAEKDEELKLEVAADEFADIQDGGEYEYEYEYEDDKAGEGEYEYEYEYEEEEKI